MKLDTLYKRGKLGQIVYWKISVEDCGDHQAPIIVKESGQLETESPILHRETVQQGKQNRSPLQQAEFQANSDWKKKHDEGYKSVSDLGILVGPTKEAYNNNQGTKAIFDPILRNFLETHLPQFNTDAAGNPKPMLATDISKIKKIDYPVFLQPKLDGVRCLMIVEWWPDSTLVTFLSRSGKEYSTLDHIADHVEQYIDRMQGEEGKLIFDGEIYSDELNFQEIVSAVKSQKENSKKLHLRVYDIVHDEDQKSRIAGYHELVDAIGSEYIHRVNTVIANNRSEVKTWHDKWVQEGYEGAMIRLFTGKYGQGQRSRDLIKVKEFDETEFTMHGFSLGQRGVEDLILACSCPGGVFNVKLSGSLSYKQKIWSGIHSHMGKKLTVKHFGLTEDGIPRFPIGKSIRDYE